MSFFGIIGASVVVFVGVCVVVTLLDVYKDWRDGWPRWKSNN
jgi:hypothetical protein